MTRKYTHLKLNEEVKAIAGYYFPRKEERINIKGRDVLAVVGGAVIDGSCCGLGSWDYALVPGYVVNWQKEHNENGLPVSEVEPISDPETRQELSRLLQGRECISRIEFW